MLVYGYSCTIAIFAHALFIGSLTRARRLVAQEALSDTWLVLYQAGCGNYIYIISLKQEIVCIHLSFGFLRFSKTQW